MGVTWFALNNGTTTVSYNGYSTTTNDAMGKNKISTQNYLGQQASSTDHNGTVLTFSYNAYGDLLKATSGKLGDTHLFQVTLLIDNLYQRKPRDTHPIQVV